MKQKIAAVGLALVLVAASPLTAAAVASAQELPQFAAIVEAN